MIGVFMGPTIQETALGEFLTFESQTLAIILAINAFFAGALPVWLLLAPRDYLSSFMKIGVFIALIIGVFIKSCHRNACPNRIRQRWRPDLGGTGLAFHFDHDCLWSYFRFPCIRSIGNHAKNAGSLKRHKSGWLRWDAC